MKEFKGTKGEWFVSGGTEIVSMPDQCKIAKVSGWDYEQAKANAQLIAASKDLLEACQMLLKEYKDVEMNTPIAYQKVINKATEAVSKALRE